MTDFNALLDTPLDQFEAPVPLPNGSYVAVISAPAKLIEPKGDRNGGIEFEVTFIEAMPDVDAEALESSLRGKPLNEKKQRLTFWISDNSGYRLREFAENHLKLPSGLTTRELLAQAPGIQFVANVTQKPSSRDPSKVYAEITSTAAMPE